MEEKDDIQKDKVEESAPVDEKPQEREKKKKEKEKGGKDRKEEEIKSLNAKLDEVNDKYVRLAAEFDNYRRRTARERLDLISTAGEDIIKGMLPVLDDCERALQVLRESGSDQAAIDGTELIYNKLMTYLKGRGLSVIEAVGLELDTDFHEAVAQMPVQESDRKNKIIDVVQQGYKLNDKVIRFAKVVVGV
ncbi:MAG TPA: nucleotide exchange factor GrpE [Candidatus Coprenecus pullistercoris]|nr:nucleotide exchange factor GrpE [Candidatus Coprenecus pullistercoris]